MDEATDGWRDVRAGALALATELPRNPEAIEIRPIYRHLIDAELFDRMAARIQRQEGLEEELAERIVDAAIGFVKLAGEHRGAGLTPSKLVDIGWHVFILYTREYFDFCRKVVGVPYVHHMPTDKPGVKHEGDGPLTTISLMADVGIPFDAEVWDVSMGYDSTTNCCAKCNECQTNGWCNGS